MDFFQRMMEIRPSAILPVPPNYHAPATPGLWFTFWAAGFAVLIFPWAIYKLTKDKDSTPLLMWIGGIICSMLEPMLDTLGHIWWPPNLIGPAWVGYGIHIPLLVPFCYAFFISMTGYFSYRMMKRGLSVKGIFWVWFAISMSDVVMEIPGTAFYTYIYYGQTPLKIGGFPLPFGWLNGTSMLMVGFLLWLVEPYLKGWRQIFMPFVTITAMGAAYTGTGWPYFLALNWPLPQYAVWLWTMFSLIVCLVSVRCVAAVVVHPAGEPQPAPIAALRGSARDSIRV